MANRTATLYIRITKNGRSSFCKPFYLSKGRLKPQYAMIKGQPEHHEEGVYYVRLGTDVGKQQFVQVGSRTDLRLAEPIPAIAGALRKAGGHSRGIPWGVL